MSIVIVDIRGTSGAGKSWVAHELMRRTGDFVPVLADQEYLPSEWRGRVIGHARHVAPGKTFVVGEYRTNCSGADNVRSQDEVRRRVRWAARSGAFSLILLEGAIISTIHSSYENMYRELRTECGACAEVIRLTTPLEECLGAIRRRRVAAQKTPEFDEQNTRARHSQVISSVEKFRRGGVASVSEASSESVLLALEHYQRGGLRPHLTLSNGDFHVL